MLREVLASPHCHVPDCGRDAPRRTDAMSKSYVPGDDADAIIVRQVAKGNFSSADDVVRAAVQFIEEYETDISRLRSKIDEADAAYRRGEYHARCGEEAMTADIVSRGEARLRRKS